MKKFFVVVLAIGLCLAIAMPASAKLMIKGGVDTVMSWENQEQDYMVNSAKGGKAGDTDRDWWALDAGKKGGVDFFYTNDAGNFGVTIGIGDPGSDNWNATHWGQAYGWWQINPMFKVTIGKQKGFHGAYSAINHKGKVVKGSVPGDINSDEVDAGIRLDAKLSDNFSFSFMVADSEGMTTGPTAWGLGAAAGGTWAANDNEQETPTIMAALFGSFGPISFAPSYTAGKFEYEWDLGATAANTTEDELSWWAASIPVKASIGPVTFSGEYNWGDNLGHVPKGRFIKGNIKACTAQYSAAAPWRTFDREYEGWFLRADVKGLGPGNIVAADGDVAEHRARSAISESRRGRRESRPAGRDASGPFSPAS